MPAERCSVCCSVADAGDGVGAVRIDREPKAVRSGRGVWPAATKCCLAASAPNRNYRQFTATGIDPGFHPHDCLLTAAGGGPMLLALPPDGVGPSAGRVTHEIGDLAHVEAQE